MDYLTASSSFSLSFNSRWNYDVFLSFRGEDTRNNFTSHLYNALLEKGVNTFIDDELRRGDEISPALLKAIEESRISIIVFSKNYVSSTWCLDELLKILECMESKGQMVRPVFYNVDPAEVRNPKRNFGEAFSKHEDKFENMEKVHKWKAALTTVANLSGWHLGDGHESKFIQRIVEEISSKLNRTQLHIPKNQVRIDSRVQDLSSLLSIGSKDVRMVGIYGIGGIGKTVIAKAIYNLTADQFEGSSFLANVREKTHSHGLVKLQETLLREILGDRNLKVHNVDRGINVISARLCHKKVLLVLDDVDHLYQLEILAGEKAWFGSGSRIIITTRDTHLLDAHRVDRAYKVKELDVDDALKLFCLNAFRSPYPTKDYMELSYCVVNYANGLPLALVVLGSFLCGRSTHEWEDALKSLNKFPNPDIYKILKISFDGLGHLEKAIFLDIACFFKGMSTHDIMKFWKACDFNPVIGIRVLIDKSLVSIEDKTLQMHDLLQAMGKQVVHEESPDEPGGRSRLWFHEDILYVLRENTGTNAIEGIKLDLLIQKKVHLSSKAFKKMKRLRLFMIHNALISGGPDDLSNELRLFDFLPTKLVALDLSYSKIKRLGEGFKVFENLKIIKIRRCAFLTQILDFSMIPNLETLDLRDCGIVKVHNSVGLLDKLVSLDLSDCRRLKTLPRGLKLKSLRILSLQRCSRLKKFPDILGTMPHLSELRLQGAGIKELPSSIDFLIELRILDLRNCTNLMNLPSSIYKLQWLEYVNLNGCSKLRKFPELSSKEIERTRKIESTLSSDFLPLWLVEGPLRLLLPSLHLGKCHLLELDFLRSPDCFPTLRNLDLSGHNFDRLPACITMLTSLLCLSLDDCVHLQEIGKLPPNLTCIIASGCKSLERFTQLSGISKSTCLRDIELSNCHKLTESEGNNLAITLFNERLHLVTTAFDITLPGSEIPAWFWHQSTEGFISFQMPSEYYGKYAGLAFCIAFGPAKGVECEVVISIDGHKTISRRRRCFTKLDSDHVWLCYIPRCELWRFNELVLDYGWSQFEVSFNCYNYPLEFESEAEIESEPIQAAIESEQARLKSCGFSLVCKLY